MNEEMNTFDAKMQKLKEAVDAVHEALLPERVSSRMIESEKETLRMENRKLMLLNEDIRKNNDAARRHGNDLIESAKGKCEEMVAGRREKLIEAQHLLEEVKAFVVEADKRRFKELAEKVKV